jgi:dolichol-phosphate mannosyltransferase
MANELVEISIVSPVYMAEDLVDDLLSRISETMDKMDVTYEIILIEDGGPDNSWDVIKKAHEHYPKLRAFQLSRNFGQHYAITAGMSKVRGKWAIIIDCDLQDRPEEIPTLYRKAQEGFDVVVAKREGRKDGFWKKMSSKWFYALFSYLTETEQDPTAANFGIYHAKVVRAILSMGDTTRYMPTMYQWVGFKRTHIEVQHDARPKGDSSYSVSTLLALAFDNILSFSDKPLRLTVKLGFWMAMASLSIGIFYIYRYFTGGIDVLGFASTIVSISFFSGIIIMILGIIGLYLGKVFENVKERPTYIIGEELEH